MYLLQDENVQVNGIVILHDYTNCSMAHATVYSKKEIALFLEWQVRLVCRIHGDRSRKFNIIIKWQGFTATVLLYFQRSSKLPGNIQEVYIYNAGKITSIILDILMPFWTRKIMSMVLKSQFYI